MERRLHILRYIDPQKKGIEVAPYHSPLLAKADWANVLTLDVFDTERLLKNAYQDPNLSKADLSKIEPVDLVGDASSIADIVRCSAEAENDIHYVVSSHNFEHLPNPLKFLRGCADILAPGGVLSMAIPDGRACFDHYRIPTRLSDWLDAFNEDRSQPSAATIFDYQANTSLYFRDGELSVGCSWGEENPMNFRPSMNLKGALDSYYAGRETSATYKDTHCSVLFPEILRLMLEDLIFLGLLDLEVIEVTSTQGLEFFVHLRKPFQFNVPDEASFYARRSQLLRDLSTEMGKGRLTVLKQIEYLMKSMSVRLRLFGAERVKQLSRITRKFR